MTKSIFVLSSILLVLALVLTACGIEDFSSCVYSKEMTTVWRNNAIVYVGSIETDPGPIMVELFAYDKVEVGQYCTFTANMLTGLLVNVYCEKDDRCK